MNWNEIKQHNFIILLFKYFNVYINKKDFEENSKILNEIKLKSIKCFVSFYFKCFKEPNL